MEWLPAISTTAILAFGFWLARGLITTRLATSVQHEFNTKLESLRADFRKSEESFKADLRAKEAEIAALGSGAMTAMASRQVALDKRRLEAIEQLWSSFIALGPAKRILEMMSVVDFDKVFALAPRDPKVRSVFQMIGKGFDENKIEFGASQKQRPFVSEMAWALFSAYQAITMQAIARLRFFQNGIGNKELLDTEHTKRLIKAALPGLETYIEEHGDKVHHLLLDILETNLLDEIRKMMAGEEEDKGNVERAAKIVKEAKSLTDSTLRGSLPSGDNSEEAK